MIVDLLSKRRSRLNLVDIAVEWKRRQKREAGMRESPRERADLLSVEENDSRQWPKDRNGGERERESRSGRERIF